jgi:hypothetical protein
MWEIEKWESWRTYISFGLVGAIFILCQALSGGASGSKPDDATADPGDRSRREATRDETSGRADVALPNVNRPLAPAAARYVSGESRQFVTD